MPRLWWVLTDFKQIGEDTPEDCNLHANYTHEDTPKDVLIGHV